MADPLPCALLMLSSSVKPEPRGEMFALHERWTQRGIAYLVHSRLVDGLLPGESHVALYASALLDNILLATAIFVDVVPLDSDEGARRVALAATYERSGLPPTARWVYALRDVEPFAAGRPISLLAGYLDLACATPLTQDSLPATRDRAGLLYWMRRPSSAG